MLCAVLMGGMGAGTSSLSDSKSTRSGSSVSGRSSRGSSSSGLTKEKLSLLESMENKGPGRAATGPRSGAAATALAAMRRGQPGTLILHDTGHDAIKRITATIMRAHEAMYLLTYVVYANFCLCMFVADLLGGQGLLLRAIGQI